MQCYEIKSKYFFFLIAGETTTGTMAVVDLDGDGFVEIVSAGYTIGKVYVHTFAPE